MDRAVFKNPNTCICNCHPFFKPPIMSSYVLLNFLKYITCLHCYNLLFQSLLSLAQGLSALANFCHHECLKNADGLSQFFKCCLGQNNLQRHSAQNLPLVKTGQNQANKSKCVFLVKDLLLSHFITLSITRCKSLSHINSLAYWQAHLCEFRKTFWWQSHHPMRTGPRKSEPACELLIFEYPDKNYHQTIFGVELSKSIPNLSVNVDRP